MNFKKVLLLNTFILILLSCEVLVSCIENKPYDSLIEIDEIAKEKKNTILKGKSLFENDCKNCHQVRGIINPYYMNEKTIQNYGESYFDLFVTKQDSLYKAKDSIMLKIKSGWKDLGNTHNFEYTPTQLYQLKEYLKTFNSK
ncbi:MAG: cytochrome c [Flavobacteriaceae bacterium]